MRETETVDARLKRTGLICGPDHPFAKQHISIADPPKPQRNGEYYRRKNALAGALPGLQEFDDRNAIYVKDDKRYAASYAVDKEGKVDLSNEFMIGSA